MLAFDTGVSGTVVSCVTDTLTDTANFAGNDVHNGHTLLITSGTAIGNTYTIDDTTVNTLVCTGDDLAADGVDTDDTYKVFYDLKVNTDGHDHDGVNSKSINVHRFVGLDPGTDWYGDAASFTTMTEVTSGYDCIIHWYKPADIDTVYFKCQIAQTAAASGNFRVYIGSSASPTKNKTDAAWETWTDSVDVSGEATGWTTILVQYEWVGVNTASMRQFNAYCT